MFMKSFSKLEISAVGTSLVVQWLRLRASIVAGTGLIPVRGTKILYAAQHGQKKKEEKEALYV